MQPFWNPGIWNKAFIFVVFRRASGAVSQPRAKLQSEYPICLGRAERSDLRRSSHNGRNCKNLQRCIHFQEEFMPSKCLANSRWTTSASHVLLSYVGAHNKKYTKCELTLVLSILCLLPSVLEIWWIKPISLLSFAAWVSACLVK